MENRVIEIKDDSDTIRSPQQNVLYYMAYFINIAQLCMITYIFGYILQFSRSGRSYMSNLNVGTVNKCDLDYDLAFDRWFYILFAINIVGIKVSFGNGQKLWAPIVAGVQGLVGLLNFGLGVSIIIAFIYPCNTSGFTSIGNICRNRLFCGTAEGLLDPKNTCKYINPANVTLSPAITLESISTWDKKFLQFFILFCLIMVGDVLKFIFTLLQPEITSVLSAIRMSAGNLLRKTEVINNNESSPMYNEIQNEIVEEQNSNDPPEVKRTRMKDLYERLKGVAFAGTKKIVTNLYSQMGFYDGWSKAEIAIHVFLLTTELILMFGYVAWFGWFQQNVETVVERFIPDSYITPTFTTYDLKIQSVPFNFLLFFTLNIPLISLMTLQGQYFTTIIAFLTAIGGFALNLVMFIFSGILFSLTCNVTGVAHNICHDRRRYCATYGASMPQYCYNYNYPFNGTVACPRTPTGYPGTEFEWDQDYIYLQILLVTAIVYYFISAVFSGFLLRKFSKMGRYDDPDGFFSSLGSYLGLAYDKKNQ